jgi:hypothetical protein
VSGHGAPQLPEGETPRWLDDPANVNKFIRYFFVACACLFLVDVLDLLGILYHKETHSHPAERWPGFYAIYGCVACVALVELAKLLRKVIMRAEDYYARLADQDAPPAEGSQDAPQPDHEADHAHGADHGEEHP